MAPRPPDAIYGQLFEGSKPIRDPADNHVSLRDYSVSSYTNYVAGSSYVPGGHLSTSRTSTLPAPAPRAPESVVWTSRVSTRRVGSVCGLNHYTPPREMYNFRDTLQRLEFV
ncbi:hypothetical protein HPB47_001810 [Ixodes persulcatus]|uniref:Uncharacterized protein n=1 Tax=Ixodes persulcatus TaxID=34615 RepID=A0AC60PND9_IXOPE|nr:hypothetical protein HPB47_001810 [Ixodes persulcatus]